MEGAVPGIGTPERTPDDYALMQGVGAGDQGCLTALYDRHSGLVYTLGLRILRDRMAAEDLLIDVFYELWSRSGRYDAARGSPLTYILTLTRSRAIDRQRSRRRGPAGQLEDWQMTRTARSAVTPLTDAVSRELGERVRAAMDKLDPAQRQAVELSFFDAMSHTEIARQLGKPLGTVKTNIRQGLIQLRDWVRMD